MKYNPYIDLARSTAILGVIFFHAFPKFVPGGFLGVDIFFVISGYLITGILFSDILSNKFSFAKFYEKRIRRIFPALFSTIFILIPIITFYFVPSDVKRFSESVFSIPFFSSNFLFLSQSGYFDSNLKPLLHTWSLSIEEQFYLLFPLGYISLLKFQRRNIFVLLSLCFFLSFFASLYLGSVNPNFNFYSLLTRVWEFLAGAILATFSSVNTKKYIGLKYMPLLVFFGFLSIAVSFFIFDRNTSNPGFATLLPVFGALIAIYFSQDLIYSYKNFYCKLLISIGLMSYSLYLIHHPFLALLKYKNPNPSFITIICCLISVFALSYLSYRYIETPFRNGFKISKSFIYRYSIFLSAILLLYGSIGHLTNGFLKFKISDFQNNLLSSAVISPKRNMCHTSGHDYLKPENACKYFSEKPTWAVFGDSHAVELSYALADKLKTLNDGVIQLSFSHCPPIYNSQQPTSDNAECSNWTKESLDYILKNSDIKNIIISYRLNLYLFGNQKDVFPKFPNEVTQNNREAYWKSLIDITNLLIASHKNVYLILQAPELSQSIDKIIINSKADNKDIVGVSIEWWKKRNQFVTDNISLVNKKVKIINPADKFCDSTNCYAVINGKSLYWDDNHMSVYGARIIANIIN